MLNPVESHKEEHKESKPGLVRMDFKVISEQAMYGLRWKKEPHYRYGVGLEGLGMSQLNLASLANNGMHYLLEKDESKNEIMKPNIKLSKKKCQWSLSSSSVLHLAASIQYWNGTFDYRKVSKSSLHSFLRHSFLNRIAEKYNPFLQQILGKHDRKKTIWNLYFYQTLTI